MINCEQIFQMTRSNGPVVVMERKLRNISDNSADMLIVVPPKARQSILVDALEIRPTFICIETSVPIRLLFKTASIMPEYAAVPIFPFAVLNTLEDDPYSDIEIENTTEVRPAHIKLIIAGVPLHEDIL